MARGSSRVSLFLAGGYALLIIYGTLFPFYGNGVTGDGTSQGLAWPGHISKSDLVINVLAYMPLGLLLCRVGLRRFSPVISIITATMLGVFLSITLEFLQGFIPNRVPSFVDVLTNGAGTLAGAFLASLGASETALGALLDRVRHQWVRSGQQANVGLTVLALWALSEVSPLVPSPDLGNLRHGLSRLWNTVRDLSLFQVPEAVAYALGIAGLGIVATTLFRAGRSPYVPYVLFVLSVLLYKVPVITQQLSLEALCGAAMGGLVYLVINRIGKMRRLTVGIVALLAAYCVDGLRAVQTTGLPDVFPQAMNFVPFRAHMTSVLGLADILFDLWPFLGMGYLARLVVGREWSRAVCLIGGVIIGGVAFSIEWAQRGIAGRTPDITDVLLALLAWFVPFFLVKGSEGAPADEAVSLRTGDMPVEEPISGDYGDVTTGGRVAVASVAEKVTILRGGGMLILGTVALAVAMRMVLHLPGVPYNVRELFLGGGSLLHVALFAVTILWIGMSSALIGTHVNGRFSLLGVPILVFLSGMVSLFLLKMSVTGESIDDIVGSSNIYWFVMNKNMWGEFGVRLCDVLGSGIVGSVERVVRYLALYSPLVFSLVVFHAVLCADSWAGRLRTFAFTALAAVPWMYVCKVVAFDNSSTDNLNELIAGDGFFGLGGGGYLYLLLCLIALLAAFFAYSAARGPIRVAVAIACVVATVPVGWWLLNKGLVTGFVKYNTVFSGVDFLLGPDRKNLLDRKILFLRWGIVQTAAVLVFAYGQMIAMRMFPQQRVHNPGTEVT